MRHRNHYREGGISLTVSNLSFLQRKASVQIDAKDSSDFLKVLAGSTRIYFGNTVNSFGTGNAGRLDWREALFKTEKVFLQNIFQIVSKRRSVRHVLMIITSRRLSRMRVWEVVWTGSPIGKVALNKRDTA